MGIMPNTAKALGVTPHELKIRTRESVRVWIACAVSVRDLEK